MSEPTKRRDDCVMGCGCFLMLIVLSLLVIWIAFSVRLAIWMANSFGV